KPSWRYAQRSHRSHFNLVSTLSASTKKGLSAAKAQIRLEMAAAEHCPEIVKLLVIPSGARNLLSATIQVRSTFLGRKPPSDSAMHQIPQQLFHARALPGVLFLGNRTGLLAEFQAKDGF